MKLLLVKEMNLRASDTQEKRSVARYTELNYADRTRLTSPVLRRVQEQVSTLTPVAFQMSSYTTGIFLSTQRKLRNIKKWREHKSNVLIAQERRIFELSKKCIFIDSVQVKDFLLSNFRLVEILDSALEFARQYFTHEDIEICYLDGDKYMLGGELAVSILTEKTVDEALDLLHKFEHQYWSEQWLKAEGKIAIDVNFI
jgi:hypothetical protein